MNLREGCRRLVVIISWLIMFNVWLSGFFLTNFIAITRYEIFAGWAFTFVISIIIKFICKEVGLWVIDGFVDGGQGK